MDPQDLPLGETFRYGWFDGIIQGRQEGESQILHGFVEELNQVGLASFSLDIDGGRFSILAEDQTISGETLSQEKVERFFQNLKTLPSLLENPQTVESTLRATFVKEEEVVEAIFTPIRGEFQSLCKRRGISDSDKGRDPNSKHLAPVSRRAVIGGIGLGIFVLAWIFFGAYRRGIFGRVLSPSAESMKVELDPLQGFLRGNVSKSWGKYQLELKRGPKYPKRGKDFASLIQNAKDPVAKAFFLRLQDGGGIWVFLLSENGKVLDSQSVSLAPLLQDSSARVEFLGRIGAKSLRLSLYPKERQK